MASPFIFERIEMPDHKIDIMDVLKAEDRILTNVLEMLDKQKQILYFGEQEVTEKEIDDRIINESIILSMKFNSSIEKNLKELRDAIAPILESDPSQN